MYNWHRSQQNLITFVMTDTSGVEATGLGDTFNLLISKAGGAFAPGAGAKGEIGYGWYSYLATAEEADTVGTVSIVITHPSCQQQNLEYVVESRTVHALEFTYTLTSSTTGLPIPGARVWFTTDASGASVVWSGMTDDLGVARDLHAQLPRLDPGAYYVWRKRAGYIFSNPDVEVVSL